MQVDERDVDGVAERPFLRPQRAPLAGDGQINRIRDSVESEEPHDEEMPGQAGGDLVGRVEQLPEPVREEAKERPRADPDAIHLMRVLVGRDGIAPVDKKPAPDHEREQREVDPVHPANGTRVFQGEDDGCGDGGELAFQTIGLRGHWRKPLGIKAALSGRADASRFCSRSFKLLRLALWASIRNAPLFCLQ